MMLLAATSDPVNGWLNYGLPGLLVAAGIIPLALLIRSLYEKQIARLEKQVADKTAELAELRKSLEPIAPALADMSRTVTTAIDTLERSYRR